MATESDVDIAGAHPYWAYPFADLAVVHNGQLTNYHQWRRRLERLGHRFQSECDSEIIAVYLASSCTTDSRSRRRSSRAWTTSTACSPTSSSPKDSLGVAKDEMAAKPLVLYESTDLVALASEEVAIRSLIDHEIDTYDPYEGEVLVWNRCRGAQDPLRRPRTGRAGRDGPEDLGGLRRQSRCSTLRRSRRARSTSSCGGCSPRSASMTWSCAIRAPSTPSASGSCSGARSGSRAASGYFGVGLIDGPEITITGRVGWSVAENMMSGVVLIEKNAGSLAGAAIRGGDLVVRGDVGARTGIDQKGGTIISVATPG